MDCLVAIMGRPAACGVSLAGTHTLHKGPCLRFGHATAGCKQCWLYLFTVGSLIIEFTEHRAIIAILMHSYAGNVQNELEM